jgi:putative addiction module killer protein
VVEIRETERFSAWLRSLRDNQARSKIAARVRRLAFGNPGDVDIAAAKQLAKEIS